MQKNRYSKALGMLSTTAVLTMTSAGIMLGLTPSSAQAAPQTSYEGPNFLAYAYGESADADDYDYQNGYYDNSEANVANSQLNASNKTLSNYTNVYGYSGTKNDFFNTPNAVGNAYSSKNSGEYNNSYETNQSGTGGISDSGNIVLGKNSGNVTTQTVDPYTCGPAGVVLSSAHGVLDPTQINNVDENSNITQTLVSKETHTIDITQKLDALNTDPNKDLRKVVSDASSTPGNYSLLNGSVNVKVVQGTSLHLENDGTAAETVATSTPSVVEVTGPDGVTQTLGQNGLSYKDPSSGRTINLYRYNPYSGNYNNNNGQNSSYNYGADFAYTIDNPNSANETINGNVGRVQLQSVVSPGGVDCTPPEDTDGDGLYDFKEIDTYNTDPTLVDTDRDGLSDGDEVNTYKTDPTVKDTDGDGLEDGDEVNTYKTNPTVKDTDKDGLSDGQEVNTYKTDPTVKDSDGDELSDGQEVNTYKTNPTVKDTDNDGLSDGQEVNSTQTDPNDPDTDGGLTNDGDEVSAGTDPNDASDDYLLQDADKDGLTGSQENQYGTDPNSADTDGDGLTDGAEVNTYKTDPLVKDTDSDGLSDGAEVTSYNTDPKNTDTDGDTLTDGDEVKTYHTDPKNTDTDGDGLSDADEVNTYKTDPTKSDTDGGSVSDGAEVVRGTNPLDASDDVPPTVPTPTPNTGVDTDGDGLTDAQEIALGTNPYVKDTDHDGVKDKRELKLHLSPTSKDTDKDGLRDGVEVKGFKNKYTGAVYRSNPLVRDTDHDGLSDKREVTGRADKAFEHRPTNPNRKDTDRDGVNDKQEVKAGTDPAGF